MNPNKVVMEVTAREPSGLLTFRLPYVNLNFRPAVCCVDACLHDRLDQPHDVQVTLRCEGFKLTEEFAGNGDCLEGCHTLEYSADLPQDAPGRRALGLISPRV